MNNQNTNNVGQPVQPQQVVQQPVQQPVQQQGTISYEQAMNNVGNNNQG